MISARKAKQIDVTTMFTYSHANTPLGQSEHAYYLSYFIKPGAKLVSTIFCVLVQGFSTVHNSSFLHLLYSLGQGRRNLGVHLVRKCNRTSHVKGRTIRKHMGGGGADEVNKKYSRKGKLNEKNSCTPINPKKYSCYGLKKIHTMNLI